MEGQITLLAAIVGAIGVIVAAFISKYDVLLFFRRPSPFNLSGEWQGMSIYIPIDPLKEEGKECIYKFSVNISQFGGIIRFEETIYEFFDIDCKKIEGTPSRIIKGKGRFISQNEIIIDFEEKYRLTTLGTIYLKLHDSGNELRGIIAIRKPSRSTPVSVKILLRRISEKLVIFDDLEVKKVKKMSTISNNLESPEDITRNSFTESTNQLFDKIKTKNIKTLDLFAYSGLRYKGIYHEKCEDIYIEHARLLFTQGNKSSDIYKEELKGERDYWESQKEKGKIGKLEIKYYKFEPSIYFCIIDNDYFNYGLMLPFRPTDVDMLRNAYMINRKETEQLVMSDFKDFFDYVFAISSSDFLETE